MNPDILCLNETLIDDITLEKLQVEHQLPKDYYSFWSCCKPPHRGYAGTAILTKYAPINVKYGLGIIEHDAEGRVLTLEFPTFYLVWVYSPHLMVDCSRIK